MTARVAAWAATALVAVVCAAAVAVCPRLIRPRWDGAWTEDDR